MKNIFQKLNFCAAVVLFAASVFAQTQTPKVVSGGVLNGKATSLVKPAYPAAAKAVNAEGAVNVQVTIDENGDVISAAATSGHPLLRAASVEAARQSKFSPTVLQGQPVKVTGVIVYNFVASGGASAPGGSLAPNWFAVGISLANLDRAPSLLTFSSSSILRAMPTEWTAEREQVRRLEELRKQELEVNRGVSQDQSGNITIKSNKTVSPEQIAIAQSLTSSLQGRLAANSLNSWHFNLGVNMSKALGANVNNQSEAVGSLRQLVQSAPVEASKETLAELENILSILERRGTGEAQQPRQMAEALSKLYATFFAAK